MNTDDLEWSDYGRDSRWPHGWWLGLTLTLGVLVAIGLLVILCGGV